jgi:hypothetical protein
MRSLSAVAALQSPVRLHGIALGHPVDLLLDLASWHAVGFVVRCHDDAERFLPYAAAQPGEGAIAVGSALMLLEDVSFYLKRGVSFRSLLGGEVERRGRPVGLLRDLRLERGGRVAALEVERDERPPVRLPTDGATVVPTRASAA